MKSIHRIALALSLLGSIACNQSKREEPQRATSTAAAALPSAPEDPADQAKALFRGRCSVCHGATGAGDGPGSAALNPKPRAFHDAAWQAGVTDEDLAKVIVQGGAATGKSPAMPGNPDLATKGEVVKALVAMIRGFKK